VPLSNAPGTFAIIDQHNYAAIRARGLTGAWFLNGNGSGRFYVRTKVMATGRPDGTNLLVARLILHAGPKAAVHYANGDPLDLRFFNLVAHRGHSRRTDGDLLDEAVRRRSASAGTARTNTTENDAQ